MLYEQFGKFGNIHAGALVKMYTTEEAATALGVTKPTIHAYIKREKDPLPATRIGLRSIYRIREDDLIAFAKKHRMDIVQLKQ